MRNRKYLYITLLSILGFQAEAEAQATADAPRLVVNITIDQLSTDCLETFAQLYGQHGFKLLLTEGLVYPNASYTFAPVDRASAIAVQSTGTTPYYNGIIGMEWLHQPTLHPTYCVYDANDGGYSPVNLMTSTVGDELKMATNGISKVFAFAGSADAAILSAGHAADGVAWTDNGRWQTSTYYQPVNNWLSGYTRLYPPTTNTNESLTEMALQCVDQAGIGLDNKPDLVSIVYQASSTMESYLELDRQLSRLITTLETKFGRDQVLFALTGTGREEEQDDNENERYRIPTGKLHIQRTANLLNMYLGALYGSEHYVESCYRNQLFINHKTLDRKNINLSDMLLRAQEFLIQLEGVRNVYTSHQLLTSDNERLSKIRNGFNIDKSGEIIIEVAPGWKLVNEDTGETTTSRLGHVSIPIIFFGAGVKAEWVSIPVTVDRIAPTIARAIRIRAPNACSSEALF